MQREHIFSVLGKFPEKKTDEEVLEMISKLPETRQELILNRMPLAYLIAGNYATKFPNKRDDILGGALLGVVYAVDRLCNERHPEPLKYISICIQRMISSELNKTRMILGSRRLKERRIKIVSTTNHRSNIRKYRSMLDSDIIYQTAFTKFSKTSWLEIQEIIQKIAQDDIDLEIMEMKSQGYKDVEICEKLSMTTMQVFRRRQKIKERFQEL